MRERAFLKTRGKTIEWSFGALLVACGLVSGARAAAQNQIHVGPLYTALASGQGSPVYPVLEVLVDVPPATTADTLTPANFALQVDGGTSVRANNVATLAASGHGIAVSIAFDASGSMRGGPLNAIRNGLGRFVDEAGPADRFAIETIADDSRWDVPWGFSRERARDAILALSSRGHLTRLWDGLVEALDRMPPEPKARRLFVISDGHDEGSASQLREVIIAARKAHVAVDAIGLTRSRVSYLNSLRLLTSGTGGLFRQAMNSEDLQDLVGTGIQRLKSMPVVRFAAPGVNPDGRSHTFTVSWVRGPAVARDTLTAVLPRGSPVSNKGFKGMPVWWTVAAGSLLIAIVVLAFFTFRTPKQAHTLPDAQAGTDTATATVTTASFVPSAPPSANVHRAPTYAPMDVLRPSQSFSRTESQRPPPANTTPQPAPVRRPTEMGSFFPQPAKDRPAAWLFGESGSEAGKSYPIDEREFWIGSLENNHMQILSDPTVSGNHACIVFDHDVLGIWDHQSTNGTRVNDERVLATRHLLKPGDRIRIGSSTFVLQLREGARA